MLIHLSFLLLLLFHRLPIHNPILPLFLSDIEMTLDEAELSKEDNDSLFDEPKMHFYEVKVLSKGSFNIIQLSHLQTMLPMQLIVCAKCLHAYGVNPSSFI